MKRIISLILLLLFIITSCSTTIPGAKDNHIHDSSVTTNTNSSTNVPNPDDSTTEPEPTPEHQHNYQTVVTAPSCNEDGYTTYIC